MKAFTTLKHEAGRYQIWETQEMVFIERVSPGAWVIYRKPTREERDQGDKKEFFAQLKTKKKALTWLSENFKSTGLIWVGNQYKRNL